MGYDEFYKVEYCECSFCVTEINSYIRSSLFNWLSPEKQFEIVGNIYEKGDLLHD